MDNIYQCVCWRTSSFLGGICTLYNNKRVETPWKEKVSSKSSQGKEKKVSVNFSPAAFCRGSTDDMSVCHIKDWWKVNNVNIFHSSEIYDITTSNDPVKKDTACPLGGGSWWLDNDIIVRISKVCQRRYKREKTAQNKEDVHAERFSSRLWLMRVLSTLWRWCAAKSVD